MAEASFVFQGLEFAARASPQALFVGGGVAGTLLLASTPAVVYSSNKALKYMGKVKKRLFKKSGKCQRCGKKQRKCKCYEFQESFEFVRDVTIEYKGRRETDDLSSFLVQSDLDLYNSLRDIRQIEDDPIELKRFIKYRDNYQEQFETGQFTAILDQNDKSRFVVKFKGFKDLWVKKVVECSALIRYFEEICESSKKEMAVSLYAKILEKGFESNELEEHTYEFCGAIYISTSCGDSDFALVSIDQFISGTSISTMKEIDYWDWKEGMN